MNQQLKVSNTQANNDGSWQVDSMSGIKVCGYTVTKVADKCVEDCSGPVCKRVARVWPIVYTYVYKCDKACYDFNNGHLCKHIHRVHSLLHTQATAVMTGHIDHQPLEEGLSLDDSEDFDPSEYAVSVIPPQEGSNIM